MTRNEELINDERWLPVAGWSKYFVSSDGRVKSLEKTWISGQYKSIIKSYPEHIKALTIDRYGYYRVLFRENAKNKCTTVHRLVATAFIPNPENKPQINHKDGNKLNNKVENLEWSTARENVVHAHKNGLATMGAGDTARNKKLNSKIAEEIRNSPLKQTELAEKYSVCIGTISKIKRLKYWL